MVVAKNANHAATIHKMLIQGRTPRKQILVLGANNASSINMTPNNVKNEHPDVRVVIVPIRYVTGYNLSRFSYYDFDGDCIKRGIASATRRTH